MRKFIALAALAALSACAADGTLTPHAVNTLKSACVIDGVVQPITVTIGTAAATVAGYGAPAAAAATLDGQAVHPAIQGACAGLNGTAVPPQQ